MRSVLYGTLEPYLFDGEDVVWVLRGMVLRGLVLMGPLGHQ